MNSTSPSRDLGRFRKLRIAFSITCGIACVLLIVLWVRSCWWAEGIYGPVTSKYDIALSSLPGSLGIHFYSNDLKPERPHWTLASQPYDEWYAGAARVQFTSSRLWGSFYRGQYGPVIPDWFALTIFATLASIPWISWRFSLRTLLIATTLVAVVLGLVVGLL
jgi:hypothetical protein